MKIQITKAELVKMFSDKYSEDVELVIVDAENEITPVVPAETAEDKNAQDEEFIIDREFTAEDLVEITGMDKILEKALRDQNYASRIPKDPKDVCVKAAEEFVEKLSRKERRIIVGVVNQNGFKKFAILWQDFQNFIHKKL